MPKVTILQTGKEYYAVKGETLLKVLLRADIALNAPCGGKGICGKCKVKIERGAVRPLIADEKKFCALDERLACMLTVNDDIVVSLLGKDYEAQIATDYEDYRVAVDNSYGDFGIAVDVGTTTVVMYLIDLHTGNLLDVISELNEQRGFGQDVISRINYTLENGQEEMRETIINQINNLIRILKIKNCINDICVMSIVGNTTMMHFVLGYDAKGIAFAPYTPFSVDEVDCPAETLGIIGVNRVIVAPSISAFVGADIVAATLVCDMSEPSLLLDLGTNGEFVIGSEGNLFCSSTAAGPAFEGAGIECGIGGVEGAISKIRIEDGAVKFATIGEKEPVGICGSGLLDGVSEMLKFGVIDYTGAMTIPKLDINNNYYISQKDIRQFQLAKSAIGAGVKTICETVGLAESELKHVYLAGGFGSYARVESLVATGIIPRSLAHSVRVMGNLAGSGAIAMLLNDGMRLRAKSLAKSIKNIELSDSKLFQEKYIDCMFFEEE